MRKFHVVIEQTFTFVTDIEAHTEEQARIIAVNNSHFSQQGWSRKEKVLTTEVGEEPGYMTELCEVAPNVVSLCTFPQEDDANYCHVFQVPKDWLAVVLGDRENPQTLENFLDTYDWGESGYIYLRAGEEGKIISEEDQK